MPFQKGNTLGAKGRFDTNLRNDCKTAILQGGQVYRVPTGIQRPIH